MRQITVTLHVEIRCHGADSRKLNSTLDSTNLVFASSYVVTITSWRNAKMHFKKFSIYICHHNLNSEQIEQDRLAAYSSLLQELKRLRQELVKAEKEFLFTLGQIVPSHQGSAINLVHYLALRHHDMRPLQIRLAAVGLSSLGRAESHVLSNLDAVIALLYYALRSASQEALPDSMMADPACGAAMLVDNTNCLLGKLPENRWTRIMVTLPTDAASDYELTKKMLLSGMDCAWINCAHDNPTLWSRMIGHTRQASSETSKECKIVMDLAGPKLRTGPIKLRPEVIKLKPNRDSFGNLVTPARILLCSEIQSQLIPSPVTIYLPVKEDWLQQLAIDDTAIKFKDARGAPRFLVLKERVAEGIWAECAKTTYIEPGIQLYPV